MSEIEVVDKIKSLGLQVYPNVAPQDVDFPVVTYFVVSERKKQDLTASIWANVKRFQVDIWSKSYKEVKELKEQIINRLLELKITDINIQDLYESDTKLYRELIQFYIKE